MNKGLIISELKGLGEAYHLKTRKVFLPPQEFLVLRTHSGKQVVGVHHNVHGGVQQTEECRMTSRRKLHSEPNCLWTNKTRSSVGQGVVVFETYPTSA